MIKQINIIDSAKSLKKEYVNIKAISKENTCNACLYCFIIIICN